MFKPEIKTKQPFASQFLESALVPGKEKLANSYMLTGSNTMDMYFLALETARVLNCPEKTPNCTCPGCGWIAQNRHPAVITISPVDYIRHNKDSKPKTVITIDQARGLKQALSVTSRYHRVIIFTDAKEGKEYQTRAEQAWGNYREFIAPPVPENTDSARENWIPAPLSRKTFHSEPANALLKLIEEPPPQVTFFFLAKDREDMIDTIVSRSQVIPLAYNPEPSLETGILDGFFNKFPPDSKEEAVLYAERLLEIAKENSLPPEELLNLLENHLVTLARHNSDNAGFCKAAVNRLKSIRQAKLELSSYVNPQAVMDSLLIKLAQ